MHWNGGRKEMKGTALTLVIGACALAFASAAPAEDLTIVSTVDMGKGKTATTTQYFTAGKIRTGDGQTDTIMDVASGRMTMIDHKKKEYYEISLDDMAATLQKLEKDMQGSPLAGMFKVQEVTVEKGTQPKKIAGYDTEHWILNMGEGMHWEMWAAPALQVPTQYYEASKSRYLAMGPMGRRFVNMVDAMRKVKGYPLATRMSTKMMMMKMDTYTEATEVKKGAIPASAFEVPAGYKKKDSPFKKAA